MKWLDSHRFTIGGASVTLGALLVAVLVSLAGFMLASRVSARIRAGQEGEEHTPRWRFVAAQITGHVLRVVTVVVALQITGIDLASVLAAGAVLAVGIGLAMQKVAENFVSGVILFAESSIREGDVIEFDGHIAKVRRIGIRATIALTLDDEEIIVPNSVLAQGSVKNLTLTESIYRLRASIGVAYGTDVDFAAKVLADAAASLPWREPTHAPVVLLTGFGSSSIDFEVCVWTRDVWGLRKGQSDLRRAIWRALRDASITIPFPQLDVHFDGEAAAPRAGAAGSSAPPPSPRPEAGAASPQS